MRESRVLILDEPSSHLDPEAEGLLLSELMRLAPDRAMLLITHRLSSAQLAHRVVVLDQGRVVEQGPPQELMRRDGLFSRMFQSQATATA